MHVFVLLKTNRIRWINVIQAMQQLITTFVRYCNIFQFQAHDIVVMLGPKVHVAIRLKELRLMLSRSVTHIYSIVYTYLLNSVAKCAILTILCSTIGHLLEKQTMHAR